MASDSSSNPTVKIPSLEFIVALLLLKSRPTGLSRKAYSNRLCSYIQSGRRPQHDRIALQHLDTAAYWKAEYEQSESARLSLETSIVKLENELRISKGNHVPDVSTSLGKRSRGGNNAIEAFGDRGQKRPRLSTATPIATSQNNSFTEGLRDLVDSQSAIAQKDMLHHVYLLQQTMAQPTPDPRQLAGEICFTANAVCRIVGEVQCSERPQIAGVDPSHTDQLANHDSLASEDQLSAACSAETDLNVIARIFYVLLDGLDELTQLERGMAFAERVAHSLIRICQCLFDRICHLSIAYAKKRADQIQDRVPNTQTRKKLSKCRLCRERHLKCDQRTPKCQNCKHKDLECDRVVPVDSSACERSNPPTVQPSRSIIKLCELIILLMTYLDASKGTHRMILEGYLFLLFDKIGKGLRQSVFGSDEEKIQRQKFGNGDHPNTPLTSHNGTQVDDMFIEAQAPYLIWLLERTQALLSHRPFPTSTEPVQSTTPTTDMALFARNKLQYTLLKAVFGDQAPTDYEPALKPPTAPTDTEVLEMETPKVDVKGWYTHEVWRLLGWDVLRSHKWRDS